MRTDRGLCRLTGVAPSDTVACVEKVIKKRVTNILLGIAVGVAIVVALPIILMLDRGTEMSFGFLDGRAPTARFVLDWEGTPYRGIREIYSFEGDFKEVRQEAEAELTAMDFRPIFVVIGGEPTPRAYQLGDSNSGRIVTIHIYENWKPDLNSTTEPADQYLEPVRDFYVPEKGWVSVEITRRSIRLWPPKYFVRRLQLTLRRNARRGPTKST